MLNERSNGEYKLSINDFFIKAAGLSLLKVPELNASWMGNFIRYYDTSDISIAVATGLLLFIIIIYNYHHQRHWINNTDYKFSRNIRTFSNISKSP